ncbi:hypothetical protein G293_03555 [Candidatus Liberibacter africanus PTSAPSY]|uniref:Uncharacterized protein n=1 Tax=Candidatus Liberibacter africanus PTSAPSY TaxID=1277257 RepID=A0A0G3I374_LIBAF|nr:hypothetical protein G293_03555 [Candidatus Liberibacter africanus PTSAPSY]
MEGNKLSQTRFSIPKSRMNMAVQDKEKRWLYRRYWKE